MCMLFVRCNNNCSKDEFPLIVVSIRDEYFMRPTRLCSFWKENPNIIGGMDLEEGREGGTWLGMNKQGQLGVLLNILQPLDTLTFGKKHRGFLVPQFLESNLPGPQFLQSIEQSANEHADFLMVTLDVSLQTGTSLSYFTNKDAGRGPTTFTSQDQRKDTHVFTFGNNLPQKPWIKTIVGRKIFENITSRNCKTKNKRRLISELLEMMNDETAYFPDNQLMSDGRGYDEDYLKGLSALKVRIPLLGFGSRTQSIILVDHDGKVTFIERTIGQETLESYPALSTGEALSPSIKSFQFKIKDPAKSIPLYSLSRL